MMCGGFNGGTYHRESCQEKPLILISFPVKDCFSPITMPKPVDHDIGMSCYGGPGRLLNCVALLFRFMRGSLIQPLPQGLLSIKHLDPEDFSKPKSIGQAAPV